MSTRTFQHIVHAGRQVLALTVLLLLPLQSFNGWTQSTGGDQPSQKPLLSRDDGQPGPNVMLTLDTSWSMIFPYVPEGAFTINNKPVIFPAFTSVIMHPNDPRYNTGTISQGDGGAIPADLTDTTSAFPRQMRSPDVNKLYYDPRVQYKPWLISKDTTTGTEVRYPDVEPSQAWFDPTKKSSTDSYADLTAAASMIQAYWCYTNPQTSGDKLTCSSSTKSFSPAVYYRLKDGTDPTTAANYTAYDINNTASFTKYAGRQCTGTTCTRAEELQNYANWFVYYRTRLHMVQGAIPETFQQLPDNKIRLGLVTIYQNSVDGDAGVLNLDSTRKASLNTWIRNFDSTKDVTATSALSTLPSGKQASGKLTSGTPLLAALTTVGEYFRRTDNKGPWVTDPSLADGDPSPPLACRRSYNVLVTDGYYTDTSKLEDQDGKNGSLILNNSKNPAPPSYTYTARTPFADEQTGTLADIAMKYWKNDLQPNIDNKVPYGNDTTRDDPAFWQHLVQFPIGLGVDGNIPSTEPGLTNALATMTTAGWWNRPNPKTAGRIDDLLHAAINSRGQYFSAKSPDQLVTALTTALNRASEIPGIKQGGVGVSSTALSTTGNVKYVPEFTTGSWIGDVKAYALDTTGVTSTTARWSAADKVPAFGSRNIVTWSKASATDPGAGVLFTWNTLGQSNQDLITATLPADASVTGTQLVSYIRGDTSNEDTYGTSRLFRKRAGSLPDFINSNPVLIKGNVSLSYDHLPSGTPGQSTYAQFLTAKAARQPVLFVGGNGGMLHAFADYTAGNVQAGQEVFAYVPKAALPRLITVSQRTYGRDGNYHQFYVDGPLVESDAYLGNAWKNILVGTMGAGGKGLFALDVTDATSMSASSILWEKSDSDDSDIGYVFSAPQVGILANGDWAVFFGNGAHSTNGKAALMIVNLSTGTLSKLVVDDTGGNGLGGVTLVRNSNRQVIGAYAGDLKGNVWRFNVGTGSTTATLLYKTSYTAGSGTTMSQPITAAPAVVARTDGGYFVILGTGKLYDDGDNDTTTVQTLYGLWDKSALGGSSPFDTSGNTASRSKLVQQTIGSSVAGTGTTYYALSSNTVDYGKPDVLGWYIDLTIDGGQRLIYTPQILRDAVLIDTIVPAKKPDPAKPSCDGAFGTGYNFLIPYLSGGRYKVPILDTNGDGVIDTKDANVSIFTSGADGNDVPITQDVNGKLRISIQNTGGQQMAELPADTPLKPIKDRVWRQILNPPHP